MDPKHILETLGVRREYTLDGMPASPSTSTIHTHTHSLTYTPIICLANTPNSMFLGGERKPKNPEETYMENMYRSSTVNHPSSGLNLGPCSCEAAMLLTVSLYCLVYYTVRKKSYLTNLNLFKSSLKGYLLCLENWENL